MKHSILLVCSLFIHSALFSQVISVEPINTLITYFPTFGLSFDTQSDGFGGIASVSPEHAYSSLSLDNPSQMAASDRKWANTLNYKFWLPQVHQLSTQVNTKINENSSVGFQIKHNARFIQFIDPNGNPYSEPEFSPITAIGLFYGKKISKKWSLGIGTNFIRENTNLDQYTTQYFDINSLYLDLGILYKNSWSTTRLSEKKLTLKTALTINQLGPRVGYTEDKYGFQPTQLRLGASITQPFDLRGGTLYLSFGVEEEKLLVPTPRVDDNDVNGVSDYLEQPLLRGMIMSFYDAPGGFQEERQEVISKIGIELLYEKNSWIFGLRGGGYNEAPFKGGRRYRTLGVSVGKNDYMLNVGYHGVQLFRKRFRCGLTMLI